VTTELPSTETCCACGQAELSDREDSYGRTELRPYGPGGALICYECAMKPANRATVDQQFDAALSAAEDASIADGGRVAHVELTRRGPMPLKTGRS
jgi:hypothetical protein